MLGLTAAVVLFTLWWAATRRHTRRREGQRREWDDAEAHGGLWTSRAACPRCGAPGGVLERGAGADPEDAEVAWFTCLACGHRHERRNRA